MASRTSNKIEFNNLVSIGLVACALVSVLGLASLFTTQAFFEGTPEIKNGVVNVTFNQDGSDEAAADKLETAEETCNGWRIFMWIVVSVVAATTVIKLILTFLVRGKLRDARKSAKSEEKAREAYNKAQLQNKTAEDFGTLKGYLWGILGLTLLNAVLVVIAVVWAFSGNKTAVEYENADDPDPDCDKRNTANARVFFVSVIVGCLILVASHIAELLILAFTIPKAGKAVGEVRSRYAAFEQAESGAMYMASEASAYYNPQMSAQAPMLSNAAPAPMQASAPFRVGAKVE